jgi:5'-methylthioadenosine phosphorylase
MAGGARAEVGIVGGTGFYALAGVEDAEELRLETPFGPPSSPIVVGTLAGRRVAFLARHGTKHSLLPTEIPYRANVYALKQLGVRQVIAVSAVGSLRESLPPRRLVILDQLVDRTRRRPLTFFGEGVVAHVAFHDPFCEGLRSTLVAACAAAGAAASPRGTYLQMEGPQFSTRAESLLHRSWGCDVVGMTAGSEARLAREAETCYATLALVTDYDAWRPHTAGVDAREILAVLRENAGTAAKVVAEAVSRLPTGDCPCRHALETALVTRPDDVPASARERLAPILAPYLARR